VYDISIRICFVSAKVQSARGESVEIAIRCSQVIARVTAQAIRGHGRTFGEASLQEKIFGRAIGIVDWIHVVNPSLSSCQQLSNKLAEWF
jgi:hypothetical protein